MLEHYEVIHIPMNNTGQYKLIQRVQIKLQCTSVKFEGLSDCNKALQCGSLAGDGHAAAQITHLEAVAMVDRQHCHGCQTTLCRFSLKDDRQSTPTCE
ncbi:hypothetical protein D3C71_1749050 [compost metagenome]